MTAIEKAREVAKTILKERQEKRFGSYSLYGTSVTAGWSTLSTSGGTVTTARELLTCPCPRCSDERSKKL